MPPYAPLLLLISLFPGCDHSHSQGMSAEETIILGDGISVQVLYFEPESFVESPPLAILMSGGYSDEFMARAQFWLGKEMVQRGWAVAVPISDQGRKFFVENGGIIPAVIRQLRKTHTISEQKPMLLGISSGGSAALAIAAASPDLYTGVIAAPGRIWDAGKFSRLSGLEVYLRGRGEGRFSMESVCWMRMPTLLRQAGARVNAALVPDARHIFPLNWEELEILVRASSAATRIDSKVRAIAAPLNSGQD
jgi:pimeloyl-ACP methyl ester carboxylesterase